MTDLIMSLKLPLALLGTSGTETMSTLLTSYTSETKALGKSFLTSIFLHKTTIVWESKIPFQTFLVRFLLLMIKASHFLGTF